MKMPTFENTAGGIFLNGFIERSKEKRYIHSLYTRNELQVTKHIVKKCAVGQDANSVVWFG